MAAMDEEKLSNYLESEEMGSGSKANRKPRQTRRRDRTEEEMDEDDKKNRSVKAPECAKDSC